MGPRRGAACAYPRGMAAERGKPRNGSTGTKGAVKQAARTRAPAGSGAPPGLRLDNLRRPEDDLAALGAPQKKQVALLLDQACGETIKAAAKNEESILHGMQLVDVVDQKTGKVAYELYLFGFGDGALFEGGTTTVVGNVVQHGFALEEPAPALHRALEAAWKEGRKRLGVDEEIDFGEAKAPPPAEPTAGAPLDAAAFWKMAWATLGEWRPLPVRRPFEVSEAERRVLEAIVDRGEDAHYLPTRGLPENFSFSGPTNLALFLGRAPPGPLDAPISVDGRAHPLWCLVSDVIYEVRKKEAVLDLIFGALDRETAGVAWRALVLGDANDHGLRKFIHATVKDQKESDRPSKGVPPEQAAMRRYVELLVSYAARLGEDGRRLVREIEDSEQKAKKVSAFAVTVALSARVPANEPIDAAGEALLGKVLALFPCDERPLRPVVFDLLSALAPDRAAALVPKNQWYAELWSSPAARKPKARAWVLA